jgi:hypothetical protein
MEIVWRPGSVWPDEVSQSPQADFRGPRQTLMVVVDASALVDALINGAARVAWETTS